MKVLEWTNSQKEGEVTEVYDKQIAKNVLKITGSTSASNYIQVPASKNLPKQALGLTGKYVYILLNIFPGKHFVVHLDYVIQETRTVRISISNLYKESQISNIETDLPSKGLNVNKVLDLEEKKTLKSNANSVQLPICNTFPRLKWMVLCINVQKVLEQRQVFSPNKSNQFSLRSFQVCASLLLKGIYTSDIQYTVQSMPKQIGFKSTAGEDWFTEYGWLNIPEVDLVHNSNVLAATALNKKKQKLSNFKQEIGSKKKSVQFQGGQDESKPNAQGQVQDDQSQSDDQQKNLQAEFEAEKQKALKLQKDAQDELEVAQRLFQNRTVEEVGNIYQELNRQLESKHIKPETVVTLFQTDEFYDPNKSQRRNCEKFILKPDPIMALDRIMGVHPRHHSGYVYFNKDEKLASELFYTQGNCIIGYHHKIQKQRLLLDPSIGEIENFFVCKGYAVSISSRENGKLVPKTGIASTELLMTLWDLELGEIVMNVKPPLAYLVNISMSSDLTALSLNGKDNQGRNLILIYSFEDLIKHQKIELLGRQLVDFELVSLKFIDGSNTNLVGCGKENIRIFKLKNNYLPSQLISLNNSARGLVFNNSVATPKLTDQKSSTPKTVYVTTECGHLYIVNLVTRQIDKILQLHQGIIQCIFTTKKFTLTASKNGILKIWNNDLTKLISEVAINQQINTCDINIDVTEICVLADDGTLSVLELDTSCFKIIMRSHQEDIVEVCHNKLAQALVSIGKDSSIKVWNCESLDQIHEFNTAPTDPPTKICSAYHDDTIAVGFKSGFLRVFNLSGEEKKIIYEIMIFDVPIMDIAYSEQGKFMAVFYKNAKIVIFNIENDIKPVKNIDYEFPNSNHFSLSFSPDGAYLANISSNANIVTVWETKNFGLRWYIDLTGDIISKIMFAPNGKDLLVLTTSAKLKYLRINPILPDVETVREQFGVTDLEPTDFITSPNNKFIIFSGKDGHIKVFDYFMRGQLVASQQAFIGHLQYANKICLSQDMRFLYTVGPGNGIYRWAFYGDREMPEDITTLFEKTQEEIKREEAKEQQSIQLPTFQQSELKTYTEEQIAKLRSDIIQGKDSFAPQGSIQLPRPFNELIQDGGISLKRRPKVEYTPAGYTFEQHQIELKKILGCSLTPQVGNNIVWDQKHKCFVYTLQNKLVFEQFDQEKTQLLKQEFNDPIYGVELSGNSKLVLAYTRYGTLDGYPQIIIWDTNTRRKVSQITIDDYELRCVHFSNYSNMLLVISYDGKSKSTIAVWDFEDGRRDYLAKSIVPFYVKEGKWNPYLNNSADEFVTMTDQSYHYWRITPTMQMQYQEGRKPQNFEGQLTAITFVEPMFEQNSVYMLIGLSGGNIWVLDTRTNSFLHSAKVLDCAVHKIMSSISRIVVEGVQDTKIHSWELKKTIGDFDYDASDPDYFFAGPEKILTLDGYPSASHYDVTAAEALFISTNNSIWLVNFVEGITVKLKSCHEPTNKLNSVDFKYVSPNQFKPTQTQDQSYLFDQNYLVGSSGADGIVKIWNMYDLEHMVNFIVPKEQCISIAMHQFKPYMVCSFTDGYLRFFDLETAKNLGRCLISQADEQNDNSDYVNVIRILPSGTHIICATKYGQIMLIFIDSWVPLSITIQNLVSLNVSLFQLDVSFLEPYNKWLASGSNGKIVVYNRQDCNSFKQELFEKSQPPSFIFMDSFNVQEYVDNCFTEAKRVNTLDHYYAMTQRTLVYNPVDVDHETEAYFLNNDLASYICFIRKCNCLLIRNFELHQVVKKIDLQSKVIQMAMAPGTAPYVFLILESNDIQMIDFVNESNTTSIQTMHESVKTMKVCPNGRYLLTGGIRGDIALWSVTRVKIQ